MLGSKENFFCKEMKGGTKTKSEKVRGGKMLTIIKNRTHPKQKTKKEKDSKKKSE